MAEQVFNGLVYGPDNNTLTVASGGKLQILAGGIFDNAGVVASVTITVAAEITNVRAISVQLNDATGAAVGTRRSVLVAVLADANGDAFVATGGSTGIAIGTDGALLPIVAKKLFLAISEANGHIDLTWTDTGTEAAFLAAIVGGKMFIGAAMANT